LIIADILKIDQPNRGVLMIGSKRHRTLAAQPGGELLIGTHQAIAFDRQQHGTQTVEHLVGAVGLLSDLRIQPDQRRTQFIFQQHVLGGTMKFIRGFVNPTLPSGKLR